MANLVIRGSKVTVGIWFSGQPQQHSETLVLNVSGRLLMVQKEANGNSSQAHMVSVVVLNRVFFIYITKSVHVCFVTNGCRFCYYYFHLIGGGHFD